MSLFDSFKDGVQLQNLILKPHLDVYEGVGQGLWQVVEILLQLLILRILEQELLFWQLVLLGEVLLTAEIHVDFRAVG